MKKLMIFAIAALFTFCLGGTALAFHGGGVAHCDGCHSMHAGSGNDRFGAQGDSLTNGSDPSSTCLNCHDGAGRYHVNSADGSNTTEGGDFHWVQDNGYIYVQRGRANVVDFSNYGHSIVAADYGMAVDANLTTAPGGGAPAASLGCTSCHDPHGQAQGGTIGGAAPIYASGSYGGADIVTAGADGILGTADDVTEAIVGNYRLLKDSNAAFFSNDAPIARANSYDGASVQYGDGMALWCANCHSGFYTQTASGGMHPTDVAPPLAYNQYVATGDFTGSVDTAYDPLVPIERGNVTFSADLPNPTPGEDVLADDGATANSNVMCLTCHRAHASPFENALRWDYTSSEFIAETWATLAGVDDGADNVLGTADDIASVLPDPAVAAMYYKHGTVIDTTLPGTPFEGGYGEYQRSLCNKCHVQD